MASKKKIEFGKIWIFVIAAVGVLAALAIVISILAINLAKDTNYSPVSSTCTSECLVECEDSNNPDCFVDCYDQCYLSTQGSCCLNQNVCYTMARDQCTSTGPNSQFTEGGSCTSDGKCQNWIRSGMRDVRSPDNVAN